MFEKRTFKSEFPELKNRRFSECQFHNCDFSQNSFNMTHLQDCEFHNCNFSLVLLDGCRMQETKFMGCKFMGVNFSPCDTLFFSPSFHECVLSTCTFADRSAKNLSFKGSRIHDTYFQRVQLNGSDFSDTDLKGTIFQEADLTHCDFRKSEKYGIDPQQNILKKAKFSMPEALSFLNFFGIEVD